MEVFKQIKNYEDLYEIGDEGTIRSLDKVAKYKGHSYLKGRNLKPSKQKRSHTAYHTVTLSKNGKTKTFSVHRLVAEHFIPNTEDKPCVNHVDNNGSNNNKTNLEWCTYSENMEHSSMQGRQDNVRLLGGIVTGEKRTSEAKTLWDSRIGTTFGGYKILHISSYGKHPKGTVGCIRCNKTFTRGLDHLIKTAPYGCKSCSLKKSYKDGKR